MAEATELTFQMNDGKTIPRIGFGTYQLVPGDETKNAVLDALEAGYRLIDCARLYDNEHSVGEAIAQSGLARTDIFVTSKVWNDRQLAGADEVRRSVEETLAALKLDYLDLLLIHWPVRDKYRSTWEQFQLLKEEGLAISIGVSNFQRQHLEDLLCAGDEVPAIDQMEFHPYLQDDDTLASCREHNIIMEAWSPLGRGECVKDEVVCGIADAYGVDAGQVILAWELSKEILPLPRSTKPEHIKSNLEAADLKLTCEEITAIDALNRMQYTIKGVDPVHFNETLEGITSPHD